MHGLVSFNGKILKAHESKIQAASQAALYGRGVFTTISIANGKPFLWQAHWQRLLAHAACIGLDTTKITESQVSAALAELIVVNRVTEGRARISLFDGRSGALWKFESERETEILIATATRRGAPESLNLTISPFRTNSASPLAGVKSCNYLENLLAFETAKKSGFDEALRLNERGEIVSACLANVFWMKNEKLYTPALSTKALAGTTREFILNVARTLEIEYLEIAFAPDSIIAADAVFLTSAGIGIVKAATLEKRSYDLRNATVARLIAAFKNAC